MATKPEDPTPGSTHSPPSPSNGNASVTLDSEDTPQAFSFGNRRARTKYNESQTARLNYLLFTLGCCRGTALAESAIRDVWLKVPQSRGGGQGIDLNPAQIVHFVKSRGMGIHNKDKRFEGFLNWANSQPERMENYSAPAPKYLLTAPPSTSNSGAEPDVDDPPIIAPARPRRWLFEGGSPTPSHITQQTSEFNREAFSTHSLQSLEENNSNPFQGIDKVLKPAIQHPTSPPPIARMPELRGPRFTPIQAFTSSTMTTPPVWSPSSKLPPITTLPPMKGPPPVPISPIVAAPPPVAASSVEESSAKSLQALRPCPVPEASYFPPLARPAPLMPPSWPPSPSRTPPHTGPPSTAFSAPSRTTPATVAPAPVTAIRANEAAPRPRTHTFLLKIRPTENTIDHLAMTPGMIIFNVHQGAVQHQDFIEYEVIVAAEDVVGYLMKTPGLLSMKLESRVRNM